LKIESNIGVLNFQGLWNLTLYNYRQTTSITRTGGPGSILKVRVEVDEIQNMELHISDFFNGRKALESAADFLINTFWQPGLPFLKPLINELVSSAFSDIFTESFRFFPLSDIIQD
jgi:Haemolymph juvenile hormone binding protein (JHBP)